jgi:hypothetical protein
VLALPFLVLSRRQNAPADTIEQADAGAEARSRACLPERAAGQLAAR